MTELESFQNELILVMQRLGDEPSLEAVESAGRELVKNGIPKGANLEGLILLRDLASMRESANAGDTTNEAESRSREAGRDR